jgi:hypothetical protein
VRGARATVASLTLRKTSLVSAGSAELRQGLLGYLLSARALSQAARRSSITYLSIVGMRLRAYAVKKGDIIRHTQLGEAVTT